MNPRRDYFDAIAPRWDELPAPPDAAAKVARFARAAVRPGDNRILDAGSGTGILLSALDRARIVECDISEAMLREGRRKWRDRAASVCADVLRPPFREAFDCVLCFGVLPHLGNTPRALGALLGCLKPGGTIAIGHMMSSDELNAFHSVLDGPVNQDRLVPARDLADVLLALGALPIIVEEEPGWYFIRARK